MSSLRFRTLVLLEKSGLTHKEAKVYLSVIELGESPVSQIALRAGMQRTSCYDILGKLHRLSLVAVSAKKNIRYYSPSSPDRLKALVAQRVHAVEEALPFLHEHFRQVGARPKIQFFTGVEGVKSVFESTLESKERNVYFWISFRAFVEILGERYAARYIARRVKRRIVNYAVAPLSHLKSLRDPFGSSSEKLLREVRYLPDGMFGLLSIGIYDDYVAAFSPKKENFGFIVQSQEYSRQMKRWFAVLWGKAQQDSENTFRLPEINA